MSAATYQRTNNSALIFQHSVLVIALCALVLALYGSASAQPKKVPRIGYLTGQSPASDSYRTEAFKNGLRELGYVEGKNIIVEWRGAEGDRDRQRALAAELVRLSLYVIVTGGSTSTISVREATSTIPIVMTQDDDPVGRGLVASLARPGGNVTGLSSLSPELSGKRLELLKEVIPGLSRVAVFETSTSAGDAQELKEIERAAGALRLKIQRIDIQDGRDIDRAFRSAVKARAEAVLNMISGAVGGGHRKEIIHSAVEKRLPVIYYSPAYMDDGGLMYYGVNLPDLARRAAYYVDKILKGSKPADLPVEQPQQFELLINLKTAKQIGLTIPPNVLARADKVIR